MCPEKGDMGNDELQGGELKLMGFSRHPGRTPDSSVLFPSPRRGRGLSFCSPRPTGGEDYPFVPLAPPWERVRVRGYFHCNMVSFHGMAVYPGNTVNRET